MQINELVNKAYQASKSKGWHETEKSPLEYHMLMVSELSEATEEARKGTPPVYIETSDEQKLTIEQAQAAGVVSPELCKPEGELIELADVVIRVADYCGAKGWDLESAIAMKLRYNETRAHRHGGKKF